MQDIIAAVSLGISVTALVLVLLGLLLGLKRGLLHSLLRLAAVVCAAGVSIVVTRALRSTVAELILELVNGESADPSLSETMGSLQAIFEASPTAADLVAKLPGALAAPLIFLVCFIVLNFVFYMIYKILKRLTVFSKKLFSKTLIGKLQVGRLLGAVVSLAASFLVVACFLAPFSGYVSFADEIVTELEGVEIDEDADETIREIHAEYITPVKSNQALSIAGTMMNPIVFDTVTSTEINGYEVVWSEEIASLADTYGALKPILDTGFALSEFGETEAAALRDFADKFDNSIIVPHIIAEILPSMAATWNRGEAFFTIENPASSAPEQLQPMMHTLVDVLETTTYDSLDADVHTLTELLAVLAESGTLSTFGEDVSAKDIVMALSKPGLISGLIDNLYANTHMRPLVTDIANLGFDAISESLEIPETDEAVRADLANNLNEAVKKSEAIDGYDQKIATLSTDIANLFDKYGVASDKATATLYAECIVGVGPIATSEPEAAIVDYFTIINTALTEEMASAALDGSPVFGATPVNAKVKELVAAYLATADGSAAENAAKLANQLRGEEKLAHAVVTIEDIHLSATEMNAMSTEDIHKQAQSLEDIVTVLSTVMVFDDTGAFTLDIAQLDANALADALFRLATTGTDSEGHEIHNIAHALTGVVKYSLYKVGINAAAANDLVNHMTTERTDGSQKNPLSSALAVLNVVQSDKELTAEDIKENISTLVQELDKETAKVLSDCISPNLFNSFAPNSLPTEQTDALVTVTKDMITNFGEVADALSPEQLEAETAYMQTIFDLAVNAGETREESIFSSEEGDSSTLNMTADTFVETITHSTIISSTVLNETESLKTAVNDSMPEADKEVLYDAIEKSNELTPELKNALLDVFGLGSIGQ